MVKEQLFINGVEVELTQELGAAFTYSVADISQPDKRKADFSKTVTLPLSKAARKVFNHIFEINIDSTYNPNLKADALYLVDSQTIFDGIIQIKKILSNDENLLSIEVNFTGKLKNIIVEFGDKELNDSGMNWDELDHTYNRTDQQNSWATSYELNGSPVSFALGSGYTYPMIYHGRHSNLQDFDVEAWFPAAYAKEYIDRMFADAGFSYSSTFFTSTFFKSLIIPFNGAGELGLSDSTIAARQWEVDTPLFNSNGTVDFIAPKANMTGAGELIRFSNEVSDTNAQHNPATGVTTIQDKGTYDLSPLLDLTATFAPVGASNDSYCNCRVEGLIIIVVNSTIAHSAPFTIVRDQLVGTGGETTTGTSYPDPDYVRNPGTLEQNYTPNPNLQIAAPFNAYNSTSLVGRNFDPPKNYATHAIDVQLEAGDQIRVYAKFRNIRITPFDGAGNAWLNDDGYFIDSVDGTWTTGLDGVVTLHMGSGSFFKSKVKNTQIHDGNALLMNDAIPRDIKQKDFFMALVKQFNLYIQPDPDNSKSLIIEPRKDFLNNTVNDWTEKQDISQDTVYYPMGALDAKNYLYTYKKDKDYYNDKYEKTWNANVYGERNYEITNDFIKAEKKLEILFSPTPTVSNSTMDYYIPHIINVDNQNQAKPVESNIRILFYGGLKSTSTPWNHTSLGSYDVQTTYPYAGMWDDPITPTVSLEFGLTEQLYYDDSFQDLTWTDNNIFNIYHKDFINEITDKDSKIVGAWFNLNPLDINNLSFRELFYFEGAYHRLQKVQNYIPTDYRLTYCEFLKLENVTPWVKSSGSITGGKGEPAGDETIPLKSASVQDNGNSYDANRHFIQGTDNRVALNSENVKIQGDNNTVGEKSYNITLTGSSGNTIAGGLTNVTLINTNNIAVTVSDSTYIDGVATSGEDVVDQKDSDFTTILKTTTYEVDTSSNDVTVTLDESVAFEGKVWRIKKTSALNKIVVQASNKTGITVEDAVTITLRKKNINYPFKFDGESNYIIE